MILELKMNRIVYMLIDLFEEEEENESEYLSFILFEPTSLRVPDNDILLIGDQVIDLFDTISNNMPVAESLADQILQNRLQRIQMMLDLLKSNNGLIMTKFLNKIWRRYSFFSNLGELFITKDHLNRFAPKFTFTENLILDRNVISLEDLEMNEDDNDDNNDDDDDDKED